MASAADQAVQQADTKEPREPDAALSGETKVAEAAGPKQQAEGEVVELKTDPPGGLQKKLLRRGSGWEKPRPTSEIRCHYVGRLQDGTVFDSSRERGQPFEFTMGANQVIKGWEIAIASMAREELALFTIRSDLAYGESGSPPKIPPHATLEFEIELLHWIDEKDLTGDAKDGSIVKKILVPGEGFERPKREMVCRIHYRAVAMPGNRLIEDTRAGGKPPKEMVVGAGQQAKGVAVVLKDLRKGEKAWARIERKHLHQGKWKVAPEYPLDIEALILEDIEMFGWDKDKETWELKWGEAKIAEGKRRRELGTELFRKKEYKRAMRRYKTALTMLQAQTDMTEPEKIQARKEEGPVQMNLALCYLKLEKPKLALEAATKGIEIEPRNYKGYMRRAQAHMMLQEPMNAVPDLRVAIAILDQPVRIGDNEEREKLQQEAMDMIKECVRLQKQIDSRAKMVYSKMFG